jgi:hypothetical protein
MGRYRDVTLELERTLVGLRAVDKYLSDDRAEDAYRGNLIWTLKKYNLEIKEK